MGTTEAPGRGAVESDRSTANAGRLVGWVVVLGLTKAADVATTLLGLRVTTGLVERNPIAAATMRELGAAPGLVGLGALTVLATVAIVEGSFRLAVPADGSDGVLDGRTGRDLCYGLAALCNVAFALHNAALVVETAPLG